MTDTAFRRLLRISIAAALALLLSLLTGTVHAQQERAEAITLQLRAAERERAEFSRTLPLWVLGAGIAALAVGIGVGTAAAFGCDGTCEMPTWIGPTIIAGSVLGSAGTVWWLQRDRDARELDLRIARLQSDLRAVRLQHGKDADSPAHARATVTLRFSF